MGVINYTYSPLNLLFNTMKSFSNVFTLDFLTQISLHLAVSFDMNHKGVIFFKLLTGKFKNFGIVLFPRYVSKTTMPNLHFRNLQSIFSNFLTSLTNVFPYLYRKISKISAMDLSAGNLILMINNKTNEITFIITIILTIEHDIKQAVINKSVVQT